MTSHPAPAAFAVSFSEGQKLAGCYVLNERQDAPGDAMIWSAQDEVLGKDVSLHFLPECILQDKMALNALRQEVKRTRALIHPNILRVYDLVEEADWAAISMDTFDGQSLAAVLEKKGMLEMPDIEPWLPTLCQTLEEAHRIGLFHRDLAPENVLVGGKKGVSIAKFGISRVVQDALHRAAPKGAEDPRLSTLSPQSLNAEMPSRADDVYGVGALLFELLTGKPLFDQGDIIQQIRTATPASISSARAARSGGGAPLPPVWEETIAACLQKNAEARPQSPAQIAARILGGRAVVAPAKVVAETSPEPASQSMVAVGAPPARTQNIESADVLAALTTPYESSAAQKVPESSAEAVSAKAPPAGPKKKAADILAERAAQYKAEGGTLPAAKSTEKPPKGPEKFADKTGNGKAGNGGSDLFLPPRQSRSPIGLVAVVALLVVGGAAYYLQRSKKPGPAASGEMATTGDKRASDPNPLSSSAYPTDSPTTPTAPVEALKDPAPAAGGAREPSGIALPSELPNTPPPSAPENLPDSPIVVVAQNHQSTPTAATVVPVPPVESKAAASAGSLEKLRQDADAAEKTHQDSLKLQQAAAAAAAETQKALDEKSQAAATVKKAVEELLSSRKQKEDDAKSTESSAQAAQQFAAEKARMAEAAKKALADFENETKERLASQQRADAEIATIQQTLTDRQKAAGEAAKAAAATDALRQKQMAALQQAETEAAQSRAAAEKAASDAEQKRLAVEAERRRLEDEVTSMRTMFEQKMKDLEERRRQIEASSLPPTATPAPVIAIPSLAKPAATAVPPPAADKSAVPPPTLLAKRTEPEITPPPIAPEEGALGLRFAPVGDVFFSVFPTRVKDFEAFARAANLTSSAWKTPGFRQTPDHPVVNVSWNEALAFCKWLTESEHKDGRLPANQIYRLPTDTEWSAAVGLPPESGKTPEARDMGIPDVYPWGTAWPPPEGAGNYTGEETGSDVAITGYNDSYKWTAPVGSFPPNKFGLYDMGGNVWQWCMDSWNGDSKAKVLRGASWYNGALRLSLLSSCRVNAAPESHNDNYGFRVVRASESPGRTRRP